MKIANAEGIPLARTVTTSIEPLDDFFHPKRAGRSIAIQIKLIDVLDGLRFDRVDCEPLFNLGPSPLGLDELVAERAGRAVSEPLTRV